MTGRIARGIECAVVLCIVRSVLRREGCAYRIVHRKRDVFCDYDRGVARVVKLREATPQRGRVVQQLEGELLPRDHIETHRDAISIDLAASDALIARTRVEFFEPSRRPLTALARRNCGGRANKENDGVTVIAYDMPRIARR